MGTNINIIRSFIYFFFLHIFHAKHTHIPTHRIDSDVIAFLFFLLLYFVADAGKNYIDFSTYLTADINGFCILSTFLLSLALFTFWFIFSFYLFVYSHSIACQRKIKRLRTREEEKKERQLTHFPHVQPSTKVKISTTTMLFHLLILLWQCVCVCVSLCSIVFPTITTEKPLF